MLWSSQGNGGSGKTHFALTAPGPIAVMLFDPIGLEGLTRQPQFREKDIRVIEYKFNPGGIRGDGEHETNALRSAAAKEALEQFVDDYATALKHARTVVWDKSEYVWEMLRYADLGSKSDRPANYYELNMRFRGWIQEAADAGVNLGLVDGLKEIWGQTGTNGSGKPILGGTGEFGRRGMKEVPELVQVSLAHRWDADEREFKIKVLDKCRLNADLIDQEFGSLTFTDLAMQLYPESSESDWA